ncbi:Vps5 C terminal like-domain-containing protein [Kockovaella imperatae]|uniref:Vps5 C terminal like-domain-containing protein n=1 Tax=Kockovaella imperatae TaxID=4999 RepID=A0A1Y1UGS2_9TREE|nr:Vps5 C terminal like-domain-containing protein [Kockovaella imperatae]ORX37263.1 Vps5 C terminal like-domain-containing protein [Kockovaella imperatae]
MDDEESFARLLSQSTTVTKPSWTPPAAQPDDPWANPFSDEPSSNPFASSASPYPTLSTSASGRGPASPPIRAPFDSPTSPRFERPSPYVQQLEDDARTGLGAVPDPPSVIAARLGEQERDGYSSNGFAAPFDSPTRAFSSHDPFSQPPATSPVVQGNDSATNRKLPPGLIDEDLLAENDPSSSLKRAFVKSEPVKSKATESQSQVAQPYVFTPAKKTTNHAQTNGDAVKQDQEKGSTMEQPDTPQASTFKLTFKHPTSIPLPESADITPTVSRTVTPQPPRPESPTKKTEPVDPPSAPSSSLPTPATDRVAVSPLDAPSTEQDYGFKGLAIGSSGSSTALFNGADTSTSSRFGGRGWGAMDEEDDNGLFGKGGPSTRINDSWTGGDQGWGEPGVSSLPTGPSQPVSEPPDTSTADDDDDLPLSSAANGSLPPPPPKPTFTISVDDPTKVGDPVRGYTVYTVRTRTTSPHYRRSEFSVLRRFSDFLWLFDILTANNPGVIVPPMPDKHPFGRFQDTFIENRRMALERCLTKITLHPVLQLDPDLRMFLESDSFAVEAKNRPAPSSEKGLLASWTGPKYVEQDDWFDSRKAFLDSLESQLKALSKSIDQASKNRLEVANSMQDFATSMSYLSDSDLGTTMCAALGKLGDLAAREKVANEDLATAEVVNLLNLSDEYLRFINSVRLAFASRIKCFQRWQEKEKETNRLKGNREKLRQQGKLGDQANQTLAQIGEVSLSNFRARRASFSFKRMEIVTTLPFTDAVFP